MSTLHLLNKAPQHPRFAQCLSAAQVAGEGPHGILLIENGVFCASQPELVAAINKGVSVWVLASDAAARGMTAQIAEAMVLIDYNRFVELTTQFDKAVSW